TTPVLRLMRWAARPEFIPRVTRAGMRAIATTSRSCLVNCAPEQRNGQHDFVASSHSHKTEKYSGRLKGSSKEELWIHRAEPAVSATIRFFNRVGSSRRLPKWWRNQ